VGGGGGSPSSSSTAAATAAAAAQQPGSERAAAHMSREACWKDSVHLEQLPGLPWAAVPSWPGTPRDVEEKERVRVRGVPGYTGHHSHDKRPPVTGGAQRQHQQSQKGAAANAATTQQLIAAARAHELALAESGSSCAGRQGEATAAAAAAAAATVQDSESGQEAVPCEPQHSAVPPPYVAPATQQVHAATLRSPRPTTYGTSYPGGAPCTLSGGWQATASKLPWGAGTTAAGVGGAVQLPYELADTRYSAYGGVRNNVTTL